MCGAPITPNPAPFRRAVRPASDVRTGDHGSDTDTDLTRAIINPGPFKPVALLVG